MGFHGALWFWMGQNNGLRYEESMRDIKIRLMRIRALLRAWEQAENESEGSSLWIQFTAELQDLWEHGVDREKH